MDTVKIKNEFEDIDDRIYKISSLANILKSEIDDAKALVRKSIKDDNNEHINASLEEIEAFLKDCFDLSSEISTATSKTRNVSNSILDYFEIDTKNKVRRSYSSSSFVHEEQGVTKQFSYKDFYDSVYRNATSIKKGYAQIKKGYTQYNGVTGRFNPCKEQVLEETKPATPTQNKENLEEKTNRKLNSIKEWLFNKLFKKGTKT